MNLPWIIMSFLWIMNLYFLYILSSKYTHYCSKGYIGVLQKLISTPLLFLSALQHSKQRQVLSYQRSMEKSISSISYCISSPFPFPVFYISGIFTDVGVIQQLSAKAYLFCYVAAFILSSHPSVLLLPKESLSCLMLSSSWPVEAWSLFYFYRLIQIKCCCRDPNINSSHSNE